MHPSPTRSQATRPATHAPQIARRFRRGRFSAPVLACLGALALTAIYGRAALLHLREGIAGGQYNGYENLWNVYWFRHAIVDLHSSPFYTHALDYPNGVSLRFHTLAPFVDVVALPLWFAFGPLAAINLALLLAITAALASSFILFRDATRSPLAAFVGAAVFTCANPVGVGFFLTGETNYLFGAALLPLFLCLVRRAVAAARWRGYGAAAVLTLWALCLSDWTYTLFTVLLTALYALYRLLTARDRAVVRAVWLRLAAIAAVWAVPVTPLLIVPMLREALHAPWLQVSDQAADFALRPAAFFRPAPVSPGYLLLAIGVLGLIRLWRHPAARRDRADVIFWLCALVIGCTLALGPRLTVPFAGHDLHLPLPYALWYRLPGLNIERKPQLYDASIGMLAAGMLVAYAVRELVSLARAVAARRVKDRARRRVARVMPAVGVALALIVTLAPFVRETGATQVDPPLWPTFYRDVVAHDPDTTAILELPIFSEKLGRYGGVYQAYQILHGKARFGASISRDHAHQNPTLFARHATFLRDVYWLGDHGHPPPYGPGPAGDILAAPDAARYAVPLLNYYRVGYIVLYLDALGDAGPHITNTARAWVARMIGTHDPIYADDLLEAYRVPAAPAPPTPVFFDVGNAGWWPVEAGPDGVPYRWADTRAGGAEVLAFNLSDQPRQVRLSFTTLAYQADRSLTVALDGQSVARLALPANVARQQTVMMTLPPGMSTVTLTSPEAPLPAQAAGGAGADPRQLSFLVKAVQWEPASGGP